MNHNTKKFLGHDFFCLGTNRTWLFAIRVILILLNSIFLTNLITQKMLLQINKEFDIVKEIYDFIDTIYKVIFFEIFFWKFFWNFLPKKLKGDSDVIVTPLVLLKHLQNLLVTRRSFLAGNFRISFMNLKFWALTVSRSLTVRL